MLAILPDIHANRQALEAVLADALACGAARWAAPGDIIGFGGDPTACAERVLALGATALRGNHEAALEHPSLFVSLPAVQRMAEKTRRQLPAPLLRWLTTLPFTAETEGIPLTHACFHAPARWERLHHAEAAMLSFAADETRQAPLAFFGHTHRPTLFCRDAVGQVSQLPIRYDVGGSCLLILEEGKRYLANPGSVGQPRDGDPRAAYALWDAAARRLILRRVSYDTASAAAATRAMGLPENFASALEQGLSPL